MGAFIVCDYTSNLNRNKERQRLQNQPSLSVNQDGRPQSSLGTAFISSRNLLLCTVCYTLISTHCGLVFPPNRFGNPLMSELKSKLKKTSEE